MWKNSFERLLFVAYTFLAVSSPSFANVKVSTSRYPNGVSFPQNGFASIEDSHVGFYDSYLDYAAARIGFIHAETDLSITRMADFPTSSSAQGTFADTLTIFAEGREGETGYITLTLSVETEIALQLSDSASLPAGDFNFYSTLVLNLTAPGISINNLYREGLRANGTGSIEKFVEGNPIDGLNSFRVPFQFGTPFTISVIGGAQVFAAAKTPPLSELSAFIDVEGSGIWLDSITDSVGNPLSNFTYTSDSGVDYSERVPEPTCGLMTLIGLFGFAATTRLRRRPELEA